VCRSESKLDLWLLGGRKDEADEDEDGWIHDSDRPAALAVSVVPGPSETNEEVDGSRR
jgi:hypothetical protein